MEVRKTGNTRPPIVIVYGPNKVGKSTFGAMMPKPIFIQTEDGLEGIETNALPLCTEWPQVIDQLRWIYKEGKYKTPCVDSLEGLERLIEKQVMKDFGWSEISPENSFGRGPTRALMYWELFFNAIKALARDKAMLPILIAHSKTEKVEDPELPSYDWHTLNLHWKAANYLCDNVDVIGFANQSIVVSESKEEFGAKIKRAKTSGESVLKLGKSPAYRTGNRYTLPDEVPLNATAFLTALKEAKVFKPKEGDLQKIQEEKNEKAVQPRKKGTKKTEGKVENGSQEPPQEQQAGTEASS